jgi:hypothetical protein
MTKLQGETGGTDQDRNNEAERIVQMLEDEIPRMHPNEAEFVQSLIDGDRPVSPRMLFWLRDIKDKYL